MKSEYRGNFKPSFLLLLILLFPPSVWPIGKISFFNPVEYSITHSVNLFNHDVTGFTSLEINLPVPCSYLGQAFTGFKAKRDNFFEVIDKFGRGRILRYFEKNSFPAPGSGICYSIEYRVILHEIKADFKSLSNMNIAYDKLGKEFQLYTGSEPSLEANSGEIIKLSKALSHVSQHPFIYAHEAYKWIRNNIRYQNPSPSHGALECLKMKSGDCGPMAGLFVSLCRARGIPSRPIAGCWAEQKNGWHCWAEFFIPNEGWIPVDPSGGLFAELDNKRIALVKSFNMEFDTHLGNSRLGFIQPGSWFYYVHGGVKGSIIRIDFELSGKRIQ